jgi:IrrE N-terminal-like domain
VTAPTESSTRYRDVRARQGWTRSACASSSTTSGRTGTPHKIAPVEAIERAAEAVLAGVPSWIWDGETLPVPLEDIADSHFGLLVRDVSDLAVAPGAPSLGPDQSLSGLLLPDLGEVWVNAHEAREWPGRRRFTIAHELGHWCMHRDRHDPVYCRSTIVEAAEAPDPDERPPLPSHEEEANAFAAALLMPARLVQEHYEPGCEFWALCERFGASGAAMGRRLHAVIARSP